jgi:hypothetical protein
MMALRAQGRRGFNGIVGSRASRGQRRGGLREDDGTAGPRMARVDGITGSGTTPGIQYRGLREDNIVAGSGTASWAWERHLRGQ